MVITKMTAKDCQEILTHSSIGRLGCSRDDQPYVLPTYFVYEPNHLYGFATEGQKIEWMRTNPKVCVEIDEVTNDSQWASVVLLGRYRELPDVPRHAEELVHARTLLAMRPTWWQTAFASRWSKSGEAVVSLFYCIEIDSMTGYRAVADFSESRRQRV